MGSGVRIAGLTFWAGLSSAAAAMGAPSLPPFPASQTTPQISRWLAAQTDLPPAEVVLVGPGYVFAFVRPDPPSESAGLAWKQVREEVTDLEMENRLGGRSASATIAFDCARNTATASNVVVYPGNSLGGEPGRSVPASDWLTANPGLYLMDLARAACHPGLRGPLAESAGYAAASAIPAPSTPARPAGAQASGPEHWVQIGAFTAAAAANRRWGDIQKLLPAQSAGRAIRLEPAGAGGKLLRALAGPFRGSDAQAFCAALKFRGGDCLVR